jgi:hypothetical protein
MAFCSGRSDVPDEEDMGELYRQRAKSDVPEKLS